MSDYFSSDKFIAFTEKTVGGLLSHMEKGLKNGPDFCRAEDYNTSDFYEGTPSFSTRKSRNAKWQLGFCNVDLTPYDYKTHDYYLGGYFVGTNHFNNHVETIIDKMQARIIVLDDSSKRGVSLFATVDCIGITNSDIKLIRRKFADMLLKKYPGTQIASVNVCSTHTHSCIDTEGLWTSTGKKVLRNIRKNKFGIGTYAPGTDREYMDFLTDSVARGMLTAYEDMCPGTLTYSKKDISEAYFTNKNRKSATSLITDMVRFIFTPDNKDKVPTLIASVGAHPDVAGLATSDKAGTGRELCGDYIYYMGELINKAGYNFMFFNGAICAIYMSRGATNDGVAFSHRYEQSVRYGRELARIALSLTKSTDEIEQDELLCDSINAEKEAADNPEYTLWYKNWEKTAETQLKPIFNIRLREVKIPVTNPIIKIVGKLDLAQYRVLEENDGSYSVITEIGYMEIGRDIKIVLVPGEFCSDLLAGGKSLSAEGSYSKKDFGLPCLTEIFSDNLIAFGLANDAIGYIVPDNDYTMGDFQNHYHELISLGKFAGSSIVKAFIELKNSLEQEA